VSEAFHYVECCKFDGCNTFLVKGIFQNKIFEVSTQNKHNINSISLCLACLVYCFALLQNEQEIRDWKESRCLCCMVWKSFM